MPDRSQRNEQKLIPPPAKWVFSCQRHDVPVLVAARLLKPLGYPPPDSFKFYAASEVLERVKDRTWLTD